MDLLGDIVEKDPYDDNGNSNSNDDDLQIKYNKTGFPELYKPEKISSWKQRLREKKRKERNSTNNKRGENLPRRIDKKDQDLKRTEVANDADSIHLENLKYMENMSEEQILREKAELLSSLNPKLVQSLLRRIDARVGAHNPAESGTVTTTTKENQDSKLFEEFEVEGAPGTWVGGYNNNNNLNLQGLPKLDNEQISKYLRDETPDATQRKTVHFDVEEEREKEKEDVNNATSDNDDLVDDDADDIAPLDYQMAEAIDHMSNEELLRDVHFVKPDTEKFEPLDINDPDFNEKLHEKYFPDLPRDIEKLKWMQPVNDDDTDKEVIIEDVSQCRFDFDGNLVPPNRKVKSTTHSGLHHHADDPQLAGYTLVELDHLARSTFPAQRCMAMQTLGRILYKLGKQSYSNQLVPEVDAETFEKENESDPKRVMDKIYAMFWDLIIDLKLIEMLELSTSEKYSKSLSVRNYATDALWLWRQGGGDYRKVK